MHHFFDRFLFGFLDAQKAAKAAKTPQEAAKTAQEAAKTAPGGSKKTGTFLGFSGDPSKFDFDRFLNDFR